MSRPRRGASVDCSDDEPYQWGNNRGGGGAPIRDKGGLPIANLLKVTKGEKGPSQSQEGKRVKNITSGAHTNYDDDMHVNDGDCGSRVGHTRNGLPTSHSNANSGNNRGHYRDSNNAQEEENNMAIHRQERPSGYDSLHTGGNHNISNSRDSNSRDQRGAPSGAYSPSSSSPKKFMGSLREMNGLGDRERELKLRKDQEYQHQLRDQIEDNKRKKEEERRGADRTKQRELSDYLRVQYKGDLPDHLKGVVDDSDTERHSENYPKQKYDIASGQRGNGDRNHHFSENSNRNQNSGGDRIREMAHNGIGNSKLRKVDESDDCGADESGRGDERGRENGNKHKNSSRRKSDFLSDSGDDQDSGERNFRTKDRDRGVVDASFKGKADQGRGQGQGQGQQFTQYQNKEGRWVTEAEYEELSALCDRLMSQQDKLQGEIQLQAGLIKDLQKKPQSTGVKARGSVIEKKNPVPHQASPGQMRSKSVQESRLAVNKSSIGGRKESNLAGGRRPTSTDGRISEKDKPRGKGREDSVPPTKKGMPPKVAFGGAAVPSGGGSRSVLSKAGKDSVSHSGPGPKIPVIAKKVTVGLAFGGRAPMQGSVERERDKMGGRGHELSPRGKGMVSVVKGPVIVTYDDDEVGNTYSKGNRLKVVDTNRLAAGVNEGISTHSSSGASMGGRSRELNGESEYIRMGEREDYISGDQLDRLLVQAKRVRATQY